MFTSKELSLLQLSYFKPVMFASDVCELQSKNSDHWMILKIQNYIPKNKIDYVKHFEYTYQLYHRHMDNEGFHHQGDHIDLLDAVLDIIAHDDYRLGKKGKTYFDEVVEMYG